MKSFQSFQMNTSPGICSNLRHFSSHTKCEECWHQLSAQKRTGVHWCQYLYHLFATGTVGRHFLWLQHGNLCLFHWLLTGLLDVGWCWLWGRKGVTRFNFNTVETSPKEFLSTANFYSYDTESLKYIAVFFLQSQCHAYKSFRLYYFFLPNQIYSHGRGWEKFSQTD